MDFNFMFYLTLATVIAGILGLIDILFLAKKRKQQYLATLSGKTVDKKTLQEATKPPVLIDYARSFFPILLLVLVIRSFLFEPYRIPTGSLKPSLLVGDFVLVNKYTYGLRLPVINKKVYSLNEPKIGDIVVFRFPSDPSINYIKRVIGMPGDKITYKDKILYVNGKKAPQELQGYSMDTNGGGSVWNVEIKQENLLGVKHDIYIRPDVPAQDFETTVPSGKYFVMGDNRDDSMDSRAWGWVPEENLLGKAVAVWFSWDDISHKVRWDRIGKVIRSE